MAKVDIFVQYPKPTNPEWLVQNKVAVYSAAVGLMHRLGFPFPSVYDTHEPAHDTNLLQPFIHETATLLTCHLTYELITSAKNEELALPFPFITWLALGACLDDLQPFSARVALEQNKKQQSWRSVGFKVVPK